MGERKLVSSNGHNTAESLFCGVLFMKQFEALFVSSQECILKLILKLKNFK